jgi:hypothetical protein
MAASVSQSSNEPGATVFVHASLREYDQPFTSPTPVRAEVTRPDGTMSVLTLAPAGVGAYEASTIATQTGVYPIRIMAAGRTSRGRLFTRERLRTAAVWAGGDQPPRPPTKPSDPESRLCSLIECLLEQRGFARLSNSVAA